MIPTFTNILQIQKLQERNSSCLLFRSVTKFDIEIRRLFLLVQQGSSWRQKQSFSGHNWCLPFEIGLYTAHCHVVFAAIAATVSDSKGRHMTHSSVSILMRRLYGNSHSLIYF